MAFHTPRDDAAIAANQAANPQPEAVTPSIAAMDDTGLQPAPSNAPLADTAPSGFVILVIALGLLLFAKG